ncbi:MAG: T9SS type A sorting domain-containing protein [Crocinitomicaceae bacterium]|nr:T9SS type A sorting domain-containing protein [Crocinitomicaceae bacterium]
MNHIKIEKLNTINAHRWVLLLVFVVSSFLGTSQISFGPEVIINPNADNARWVDVIDMDGDGDMDVLSASQNDGRIAWYENDGSESFTQFNITTTLDKACGVVAADFDGDGDIDVAAASMTNVSGRVVWFQNDGSQNFTMIDIQTNLDRVHSIAMDDIDGDGDMDLLAPIRDLNQIRLFKNDGLGNFTPSTIISGVSWPRTVWVEDIDGDGDRDIAYQGMLGGGVYWAENDGSENFMQHTVSLINVGDTKFVSAGDMDGDGDIDLLSASKTHDRLSLHRNDGSENFTQELITNSEIDPFCIIPVDLDFDGDLDLVVALNGENHFAWYVNDGTGNFGPKNIISGASTCAGATYIMPKDLDGDGDLDAIVSAGMDDDVSWFNPIVLPVEGLKFQGEKQDRTIDLYWKTETEINNDYFDVQRSIDGINFESIGVVKGSGNTQDKQYYDLTDENPVIGLNYYRLQQFDFDGEFEYSNTIAFQFSGKTKFNDLTVHPNPASNSSQVLFNANKMGKSTIKVYNSLGKLVFEMYAFVQKGLNAIEINLSEISTGMYTLSLELTGEIPRQTKLIRN